MYQGLKLSCLIKEPYVVDFLSIWRARLAVFFLMAIFLFIVQLLFLDKGIVFTVFHSLLASTALVCS